MLTRVLRTKSTILHRPPKGTEGLDRNAFRGNSLSPFPPAKTKASILGYINETSVQQFLSLKHTNSIPYSFKSLLLHFYRYFQSLPIERRRNIDNIDLYFMKGFLLHRS